MRMFECLCSPKFITLKPNLQSDGYLYSQHENSMSTRVNENYFPTYEYVHTLFLVSSIVVLFFYNFRGNSLVVPSRSYGFAMVWMYVFSPNSLCWNLTSKAMVLRSRAFSRWLSYEGGALTGEISALIRKLEVTS